MNRAITISRDYGIGGREIGEKLARRLGIPFYDKELIAMIAKEGNIETSVLEANDEVDPDFDNYSPRPFPRGLDHGIYPIAGAALKSPRECGADLDHVYSGHKPFPSADAYIIKCDAPDVAGCPLY